MSLVAETTLAEAVPPGIAANLHVPGLRYGTIVPGSSAVTVGGFPQSEFEISVDLLGEVLHVKNTSANPWPQGALLVVAWEGTLSHIPPAGGGGADPALEGRVTTLEERVTTHDWELQAHEQRINKAQTDANSANNKADDHETRIAALEGGEEAEDEQNEAIQDHELRITANTDSVVFHQEQLDAHAVRIDGHETRIATLENSVDPALPGKVIALETEVDTIDLRVTALEDAPPPTGGEGTGGVPSTGGTFTGPVVFKGSDVDSFAMVIDTPNAADGCSIQGRSAGVAKWELSLGGPGADADFAISRYPLWEAEFPQDSPLVIYRATGFIKLIIPERADSEAAGDAGVPIGGLYQTNGTVKIRTY